MGLIVDFISRVGRFQPTTWYVHIIVAWALWLAVDILPKWGVAIVLTLAAALFFYREYQNYLKHKAAGHNMRVWIGDGIGDMVGPLTVIWAAMGNPWVAHTFGLGLMGIGSVVWVGFGYAHYGGHDA